MGVPNKQIGWSQESNLLWEVSKLLDQLINHTGGVQGAISLTTNGDSGPATLINNILNVPEYTLEGLGGVPLTRTITINGDTQSLADDVAFTVLGSPVIVVTNYSALPDPATVPGAFYWAEQSQGSQWIPAIFGGTYHNSGLYYSNGVAWTFMETPYQATQPEVDAGILFTKFVTPLTFENAFKWTTKQNNIILTTDGTSGPAEFDGTTLNIPEYTGGTGGGTEWMGDWVQQEYTVDQQVIDEGYLAIANKTTIDRPAPQPLGQPYYVYAAPTISTTSISAKQVIFGNRYNFQKDVILEGWRVNVVAGNDYSIYLVKDPTGTPIVSQVINYTAQRSGWVPLNVATTIIKSGSTYDLVATVSEPESTSTIFTANYDYKKPANFSTMNPGDFVQANSTINTLRISKTDENAIDRSAQLAGLVIGDIIIGDATRWAIQSKTDNGTHFTFVVSPPTQITGTGLKTFTFESTAATPITYPFNTDYWLPNPSPGITAEGLLAIDNTYFSIVPNDTAYGVDILVQEIIPSADWDIQAFSGLGGSSGGGIESIVPGTNIAVNNADPLNPIVSAIPSTSAGVFDRVYFTGQVASVATPVGPNYDTIRNGKGSVASVPLVVAGLNTSTKLYIPNDMIGPAQIVAGILPIGNYTSFLSVQASAAISLKRFTIEVFLCNNAGVIIPSSGPVSDSTDPFYAGKNTVVILDSGDLNLANDDVTQIGLTGYLASPLPAAVGQRFRYHISVSRGTGGAGAQTMTVYIGSNANSYVEAPIPITSTTVINLSSVPGATVTDALNALNSGGGGSTPYTVVTPATGSTLAQIAGEVIVKCDATAGAFTINLPTAVGNTAKFHIKKMAGTNPVTIDAFGTQTIDGGLTATILVAQASITLVSDNINWLII